MNDPWPVRGPWVIAATSAEVDGWVAVAALVAAAPVRVALVALDPPAGPPPVAPGTWIAMRHPADIGLPEAAALVRSLTASHGLVLVAATPGFLVPVGRDGWTLADLAAATRGGAVVVTGPGADAVNHTTLALGALAGHGIPAAVVVTGDVDEAALPVTPAGRIPAERPDDLAAAPSWFEPLLRAGDPPPAAPPPHGPPPISPRVPLTGGKRVVLGLLAVFVVMALLACGFGWVQRGQVTATLEPLERTTAQATLLPPGRPDPLAPRARPDLLAPPARPDLLTPPARPDLLAPPVRPAVPGPRPDSCPQHAGRVVATRPDAATTARVNAAWRRIETWLAAHAPASRRALRPPAPAAAVDALQRRMSVAFPADLVASLHRHDGAAGMGFDLPPFFTPTPLAQILRTWVANCGVRDENTTDDVWWDRRFVPFASAGDGGALVVDQRPGGHGRVGEFYPEDGTSFERWPASVAELLTGTAAALETGRPYLGSYRPEVSGDGHLTWRIG